MVAAVQYVKTVQVVHIQRLSLTRKRLPSLDIFWGSQGVLVTLIRLPNWVERENVAEIGD